MAEIDVGYTCADLPHSGHSNYTVIGNINPANDSGTIDYICVYAAGNGNWQFAAFTNTAGTTYSTNGTTGVGTLAVASGLNEFNAPGDFTAFPVTAGDFAGAYCAAQNIKTRNYGTPTGSGVKRVYGDQVPAVGVDFGADENAYDIALRFEGETAGGLSIPVAMHHYQFNLGK